MAQRAKRKIVDCAGRWRKSIPLAKVMERNFVSGAGYLIVWYGVTGSLGYHQYENVINIVPSLPCLGTILVIFSHW